MKLSSPAPFSVSSMSFPTLFLRFALAATVLSTATRALQPAFPHAMLLQAESDFRLLVPGSLRFGPQRSRSPSPECHIEHSVFPHLSTEDPPPVFESPPSSLAELRQDLSLLIYRCGKGKLE